jgi:hypothetical protein
MGSARLPFGMALCASSRTLCRPADRVDLAHRLDVRAALFDSEFAAASPTPDKLNWLCRSPAQLGLDVHDGWARECL